MVRTLQTLLLTLCVSIALISGSFADQINGNWCSPGGKTLSINDDQVITPAGNRVTANFDRHHIDYQIPAGEPHAGDQFTADQLSDEELQVRIVPNKGPVQGASEIWTPCKPTV